MDAPRPDEMSDTAIDRDLQAMLAADPSPAFVARVRAQVGAEATTSRPWFIAWSPVLAVTAAIALAIVTVVGYRGSRARSVDRPPALSTRAIPVTASVAAAGSLVTGLERSVADRRRAHSREVAVATPAVMASVEPEVLVDPREAAALRAFFARARSGDVALAAIMAPPATPLADSNDLHDIYIAPIAFEPVNGAAEDKGVRQ